MKILYIESKLKDFDINLSVEEIKKLPSKIFLAFTIQYKVVAEKIKSDLVSNKINVTGFASVLGCSKINTKDPVLLIGTGKFHSFNLFFQSPAIYIIEKNEIKEINKEIIETLRKKRKVALTKYLSANNIGILVSTKPGQENLKKGVELRKNLVKQGKNAYIFLSNNINILEFENFNIDSWVNTACIGLSYDNSDIINLSEIDL